MSLSRETFFEQAGFFVKYIITKAPLPIWMRTPLPEAEQLEQLSEVQQLACNIALDLGIKGVDPASNIGRAKAAEVMEDILKEYHWLN